MALMDVIRCDLRTYLVWKWKPFNADPNKSTRQNSIRWGSSLRVKDGELAVFVYNNKEAGKNQDFIMGPFDEVLKTSNLPILSSIIGAAYDGASPFQAEIYFINLANVVQVNFEVPQFDVFDPRFPDLPVPVKASGVLTVNITDYENFIKTNRLIDFSLMDFKQQISSMVSKFLKSEIVNTPGRLGIPVVQLETQLLAINEAVEEKVRARITDFGVNLKAFDIDVIQVDKSNNNYKKLNEVTSAIREETAKAQAKLNIENMEAMQRINKTNMEETMRAQREEMQYAQRMQTDSNFFNVHALNQQTSVMHANAEALGQMGQAGAIGGGNMGGGINPAGVMTNMMMGGAIGGQMAGMMTNMTQSMNQTMNQAMQTPPPMPQVSYFVFAGGQQMGPFGYPQLQQLVVNGQMTLDTLVWKQGMAQWAPVKDTELQQLFGAPQPPMPPTPGGMPPMPPSM